VGLSKNNMKEILDDFHYHEMLDRIHVIACNIEDHLVQHPVFKLDKEISKPIEDALFNLAEAYQITGQRGIKENEKNN